MRVLRDQDEIVLGICGGVGPAAGLALHQLVLSHTKSQNDQGHFNVIHISRSEDITCRVKYLENPNEYENPAFGMFRTYERLVQGGISISSKYILAVPCNTFHVPLIWNEFKRLIALQQVPNDCIPSQPVLVHIVQETINFVRLEYPRQVTTIGILSTVGTQKARIYHDGLEPLGYKILDVSAAEQEIVQDCIYNSSWGLKVTAPYDVAESCREKLHTIAKRLIARGADLIVLGCTELPFAFPRSMQFHGTYILDPLVPLARAMIREADPSRLKPLEFKK